MKDILLGSITNLSCLYRTKQVSPVELVSYLFGQIEKENPRLNAFITLFKEEALQSASKAESKFLKGEEVPLLTGVPYSLKDLFYTKDRVTTCGSIILKDFIPDYNATVVDKLEQTGAVLIGKTNMLEFAYGIVHPDYGQTNNPRDVNKTAGGSSGGSAAAVAAGLGYFSLGTDTGGSIRIPASYCGVAGLKPTYGAVSLHGVFPLSWSLDHAGPIARTVEDIEIVFQEIAGFDSKDPYSSSQAIYQPFEISSKQAIKIGVLPQAYLQCLEEEVRKVYFNTLELMKEMGWELVPMDIPNWQDSEEIIMKVLLAEAAHIHQPWISRKKEYAPNTFQQIEAGLNQKTVDYLEGLEQQKEFRKGLSAILSEVDSLFMPTVALTAPAEDPVIGDYDKNEMTFTGPFNLSGHPAVTVNLGFSKEGMPIGMQFVGKDFREHELLQIARIVEQRVMKSMG